MILGLGRSPGVGNGNLFQYSDLGKSMDREAWWATVHEGCKESDTTEHTHTHTHTHLCMGSKYEPHRVVIKIKLNNAYKYLICGMISMKSVFSLLLQHAEVFGLKKQKLH